MTLRLRQGERATVTNHPLGVTEIGYQPGMSQAAAFACGRGTYKLNAENVLLQDQAFVTNLADQILAVATISGVTKYGARRAVEGTLLLDHERVGTQITVPHPSRNPVSYADEDELWHHSPAQARWHYVRALEALASERVRRYDEATAAATAAGLTSVDIAKRAEETLIGGPNTALVRPDGTSRLIIADPIDWTEPQEEWTQDGFVDSVHLDLSRSHDIESYRRIATRSGASDYLDSLTSDVHGQRVLDAWARAAADKDRAEQTAIMARWFWSRRDVELNTALVSILQTSGVTIADIDNADKITAALQKGTENPTVRAELHQWCMRAQETPL